MKRLAFALVVLGTTAPLALADEPRAMKDCGDTEDTLPTPDAAPPNMKVPASLLVEYVGELTGAEREKFIAAATVALARRTKLKAIPEADLAAATALVAQNKMTADGPSCGLAPSLVSVVAAKAKHVVVAAVDDTCAASMHRVGAGCSINVTYRRAGATDDKGLPHDATVILQEETATLRAKIAALRKLEATDDDEGGVPNGLLGGVIMPVRWLTHGLSNVDPWMRPAEALHADALEKGLARCVNAPGSFDATVSVSEAGKTTQVSLTAVSAPPAKSSTEACVKEALASAVYACPASAKPVQLKFRVCAAPMPRR